MKKTTFKIVYNRLKKLNKDGKGLIQIESYLNGKRKYMSTGIRIEPKFWNEKTNRVKNNHPDFVKLNRLIDQLLRNVENFEFNRLEKTGEFSLDELGSLDRKNKFDTEDFIIFCRDQIEKNTAAKSSTKLQHTAVINKLENHKPKIRFREINYSFIKDYDDYLRTSGLHQNSIANQHKTIKAYINLAIKKKLMSADEYPYRWFKIKRMSTKLIFLTLEETERLERLKFTEKTKGIEQVRDMFVFSCYTGLRYSDVQALKPKDIVKENGDCFIEIRQEKTGNPISLPVSIVFGGKALKILQKYTDETKDEYLFPRIYNKKANDYLKIIAKLANIDKVLTFHVSRHSFGTNLASATSDQFLIKELMGHKDIRTSMTYIHTSKEQIKTKLKNANWNF